MSKKIDSFRWSYSTDVSNPYPWPRLGDGRAGGGDYGLGERVPGHGRLVVVVHVVVVLVVGVAGPGLRREDQLGELELLLGVLLGGELPDDPGDLGPLVLGALLGEPGPQVGDREGEVFDGGLKGWEANIIVTDST